MTIRITPVPASEPPAVPVEPVEAPVPEPLPERYLRLRRLRDKTAR